MATLVFPTLTKGPAAATFGLVANTGVWTNPIGGTEQDIARPGAKWSARVVFPPLTEPDRRLLSGFLAELDGRAGRFLYGDPSGTAPQGAGTGTPQVDSPGQTGNMLVTDGWTASTNGLLKVGDYFTFGTAKGPELKILTDDLDTDVNGRGTLVFRPNIRIAPADNEPIDLTDCQATMRLVDDNQAKWGLAGRMFADFQIDMIEFF